MCLELQDAFFQVYEHADGSKSLKLGDFGLATVVDGPLYTVCGTPTYVAPEIIAETGYEQDFMNILVQLFIPMKQPCRVNNQIK